MNDTDWILQDLTDALDQLDAALAMPAEHDVVKAGCIQYFEFCFELSWKAIRQAAEKSGLEDCLSPKACLKLAFAQAWIDDEETWLEMLESRNRISHTYDARRALAVYDALPRFANALRALCQRLRQAR
jgi:nucleotidyltransferase substrate binding protein (TIGR01987 family)